MSIKRQFVKTLATALGVKLYTNEDLIERIQQLEEVVYEKTFELERVKEALTMLIMASPNVSFASSTDMDLPDTPLSGSNTGPDGKLLN